MVKIPHPAHPEGGYYMEKDLYENIKELPKRIEKDKDVLGVFVGSPGEGKSTLAQQVLYFLDPKLALNSVKYTYEDYVKYCISLFEEKQSRGRGVIHDEGRESLSSMGMMTKRTRKFMNFLYENRQMNMYQFILSGDFFDLPKSVVMQRLSFMIYVHEEGEFENGYFKFFNRQHLRKLYVYGKKERNMEASSYTFRGTFSRFYTIDEQAYRKLKRDHLKIDRYVEKEDKSDTLSLKQVQLFAMNRNPDHFSASRFAEVFKCDVAQVFKYKKMWELGEWNEVTNGGDEE